MILHIILCLKVLSFIESPFIADNYIIWILEIEYVLEISQDNHFEKYLLYFKILLNSLIL